MKSQLIYKSSWCTAEPTVYIQPTLDETVDRFIGKVFANRTNRVVQKEGKYFYIPSDNYIKHVVQLRKIR